MAQLTEGSIKALYDDNKESNLYKNPVVQIVNIKAVPASNAMFSNQLTSSVEKAEVVRYSIVRLKEFVCNKLNNRRVVIIISLDVVNRDHGQRIGSPASLEAPAQNNTASSPTPATTSAAAEAAQPMFVQSSSSYSAPAGRQNAQLEASLFPIKALNPYQNKWTIKARVTQKSEIKHWHNARSDGKLFSVNLLDKSGEIKGTAFNDQVDRLYHILEEGKVYYISKARVSMAKKQFSTLDNEYELSFDNGTEIEVCSDEVTVPKMSFNFVKIADIDNHEKGSTIDVIGIVRDDNGIQEIVSKATGRPTKKREVVIVDDTQKQIRLTLWDRTAEQFDGSGSPVIAVKGARVGDFGGRSLSLSSTGQLKVNPDVPERNQLTQWYNMHGTSTTYATFSNGQAAGPVGVRSNPKITLQQAKTDNLGMSERPDYFIAKATVVYIRQENPAYPSCPTCMKKMVEDAGWRYLLTLSMEDATSQVFMNAFDEIGNQVLGTTANELMKLKENDLVAYQKAFTNALFKTYNVKVRAKSETYNATTRTKYQILEATPIDFVKESQELAAAVEKLVI
ncbi:Replication factor A protein 1 [Apophysomyces ossiformis]|uniref:Replication protein A subunit n=1 Tax=Apophysomyces ossiformis TaxID=679940 RepID=A0A8H7BSG5_9FUNG|nr:Replication factor A protein 1 [Apophysomyces ossiformis]